VAASWMVRVGNSDEVALRHGVIAAQWPELGDISHYRSPKDVRESLTAVYEEEPSRTLGNYAGQLWRFLGGCVRETTLPCPWRASRSTWPSAYRRPLPLPDRRTPRVTAHASGGMASQGCATESTERRSPPQPGVDHEDLPSLGRP
jgi:hypothetical protein